MADNDLELHVKTTADLAALKQVKSEVDDLSERTKKLAADWRETGTLRPAPGLTEAGGPFGAGFGGAGTQGLTSVAADSERAEKAALGFGLNLARARNEAIILAREIATGTVSMRTLSALLGSLGAPFAVAGVEAMVVVQSLRKGIEEAAKFNAELKEESKIVGENAEKWRQIAQTANSQERMSALVGEMVPALEQVNAKLAEINGKQLSLKQRFIENTAALDKLLAPMIGWNPDWFDPKMFQQGLDQTKKFFGDLKTTQEDSQRQSLQTSIALQKAFDADKLRPASEVIEELNRKIQTMKELQDSLADPLGADLKTWQEINKQLELDQAELKQITDLEKKRQADQNKIDKERRDFNKINEELLDDQGSAADRLAAKIAEVTAQLKAMGVAAKTPAEAFELGAKMAGETGEKVRELAKELAKLEVESKKGAAEAIKEASPQVQRIIANEQAAKQALAAGDERSAEMFQKSAEAYKAGMNPQQAAELQNIKQLQQQAAGGKYQGPPRTIEEWRQQQQEAFDAYQRRHGAGPAAAPSPINVPPGYDINVNTGELIPKGKPSLMSTDPGKWPTASSATGGEKEIVSWLQKIYQQWA